MSTTIDIPETHEPSAGTRWRLHQADSSAEFSVPHFSGLLRKLDPGRRTHSGREGGSGHLCSGVSRLLVLRRAGRRSAACRSWSMVPVGPAMRVLRVWPGSVRRLRRPRRTPPGGWSV
jgi:hypothetical protein